MTLSLVRAQALVLSSLLLAGCAVGQGGKFTIQGHRSHIGDRPFILSEHNHLTAKPYSVKLSKTAVGLFANPAMVGNNWYLLLENVIAQNDPQITKKRINPYVELQVVADDNQFTIRPSEHDLAESRILAKAHRETATFQLTETQLVYMINAQALAVTVVGNTNSIAVAGNDLAPSFQFHLYQFYKVAKARQTASTGG